MTRMSPGQTWHLPGQLSQVHPVGRRFQGRHRECRKDYISVQAWKFPGKLEYVARRSDVWASAYIVISIVNLHDIYITCFVNDANNCFFKIKKLSTYV